MARSLSMCVSAQINYLQEKMNVMVQVINEANLRQLVSLLMIGKETFVESVRER